MFSCSTPALLGVSGDTECFFLVELAVGPFFPTMVVDGMTRTVLYKVRQEVTEQLFKVNQPNISLLVRVNCFLPLYSSIAAMVCLLATTAVGVPVTFFVCES